MNILKSIPVALALLFFQASAQAGEFESPLTLKATDLLPPEILDSDLYQIQDKVENDGFMNRYIVSSQRGKWEVPSNALLDIRLREIIAMSEMRRIEEGSSFSDAIQDDAKDLGEGAVRELYPNLRTGALGVVFTRSSSQFQAG